MVQKSAWTAPEIIELFGLTTPDPQKNWIPKSWNTLNGMCPVSSKSIQVVNLA